MGLLASTKETLVNKFITRLNYEEEKQQSDTVQNITKIVEQLNNGERTWE